MDEYLASLPEKDHQVGYIFEPREDLEEQQRPSKKRKVSRKHPAPVHEIEASPLLVPLFDGSESAKCVQLRERLFSSAWSRIESRIEATLRDANKSTLDEVRQFVAEAAEEKQSDEIASAFIVTGANIASQDLLFEQLGERLRRETGGAFVRIRSGEAPNLKATLKRIIREATKTIEGQTDDDLEISVGKDGRKYLDYDLEALHQYVKAYHCPQIFVAFQDSEGFDSGLLSDVIELFRSWGDRITFTLVFGIATSVDLFQARLLKSVCRYLYGEQFDVALSSTILARIVKTAVAASDVAARIGPGPLGMLLERQRDHVAGIEAFVSSLKFAYMCHFFANPLSILLDGDPEEAVELLQTEHLDAVRTLASFRTHVEANVEEGSLRRARSLLTDNDSLVSLIRDEYIGRQHWISQTLRSLHLLSAAQVPSEDFSALYIKALSGGIDMEADDLNFAESIRRMNPDDAFDLTERLIDAVKNGDGDLGLPGWEDEDDGLVAALTTTRDDITKLRADAEENGSVLRSKHMAQSRALRTTVIAQKVQLSRDSAALTDEDKAFTKLLEKLAARLARTIKCGAAESKLLHEAWLFDSKLPYRDVFVPRPRAVIERALSRPHDYLACTCCNKGDGLSSTSPAAAILYQLYLETGALINVADLWTAFYAIVGGRSEDQDDERAALLSFYQGLAEMRFMGFVKPTRKKSDHVAKLAWKGL